MRVFWDELSL